MIRSTDLLQAVDLSKSSAAPDQQVTDKRVITGEKSRARNDFLLSNQLYDSPSCF